MKHPRPPTLRTGSPTINRLLTRLRRKIRWYVFLGGISLAVVWLALSFWILLAIDFLPVRFGFKELSVVARIFGSAVVLLVLLWILVRQVLNRLLIRIENQSLAVLVERKFPAFEESLITSVNRFCPPFSDTKLTDGNVALLELARLKAESLVPTVTLDRLLNRRDLRVKLSWAGLAIASLLSLWISQPKFTQQAAERLIQLADRPWLRWCELELVGIKVARENSVGGINEIGQILPALNQRFVVSQGAAITILARATAPAVNGAHDHPTRKFPDQCRLVWRSENGSRGSQSMNRIGAPRDGFQLYTLDGPPFHGMLSEMKFEIRGGDARIGPFTVSVVDPPVVVQTNLRCVYPEYMVDADSGRWTPRDVSWSGPAEMPHGTAITIRSTANKPLRKVYVLDSLDQQMESRTVTGSDFSFQLEPLIKPIRKEIFLCDQDGLVAEHPFVISLDPITDQPPSVQTQLKGIGTAITPNARIPFEGEVRDDYLVASTWLEIDLPSSDRVQEPLAVEPNGKLTGELDFLNKKRMEGKLFELLPKKGATVSLIVKAADHFNLSIASDSSHIGFGDKWVLDVVDDGQLLRILERQEVGQRRRLEQIYLELGEAQSTLERTSDAFRSPTSNGSNRGPSEDVDDSPENDSSADDKDMQSLEMRILYAQRTHMQIDKSRQEILGVADSFENIRLQLVNNRIDSEDRKRRLSGRVEKPLREIGGPMFEELKRTVIELEDNLRSRQADRTNPEIAPAAEKKMELGAEQMQVVRIRLSEVLDALVKYETQNELLEIVRKMIRDQESILERTKKERQERAFEGLLD